MDNLGILDLVIGLFFIYFIFSVICSSVVEGLSQLFNWRSVTLERWMIDLFKEKSKAPDTLIDYIRSVLIRIKTWFGFSIDHSAKEDVALGTQLAKHHLIHGLTRRGSKPDYIPAHVFSSALFSLIHSSTNQNDPAPYDPIRLKAAIEGSPLKQEIKAYLLQAFEESQGSISLVKKRLEIWFDDSMEGLIEAYKKRTRVWAFYVAIIVAGSANVDTIVLTKYLYEHPEQAAILAGAAEKEMKDSTLYKEVLKNMAVIEKNLQQQVDDSASLSIIKETKESVQQAQNQYDTQKAMLKAIGLPLGWEGWNKDACWVQYLWKVLGLLLTTLALTLGAPFWFDTINKLVNIRSAGDKPSSTANPKINQTPAG
jgi:hypothetical protein